MHQAGLHRWRGYVCSQVDARQEEASLPDVCPTCMAMHAGTVHVPAEQLPAALKMAPRDWESAYRLPKPSMDDWLVMQSRTHKRAAWAAQVAQDQGWLRVLVHREASLSLIHMSLKQQCGVFFRAGHTSLSLMKGPAWWRLKMATVSSVLFFCAEASQC